MSAPDQRCVLVRHGETAWSREGRHTGRTELPLLAEGAAQVRAVRPVVERFRFALVLTSPLLRAHETAELLGLGEFCVDDPDLLEWDYGSYEGRTTAEIRRERPGWSLFDDGTPGGERVADVGVRADRIVARVRSTEGDVACIAHAHVLRVLAARWVGLPAEAGRYLVLGPASLSILGWEREQPVVREWNQCVDP